MSNATTLQTNNNKLSANNTDLASILNTINNLPEAGSSGGSGGTSIDTCTVKISCYPDYGAYVQAFAAMVWDGEKIAIVTDGDITKSEFTIENVICGSFIVFRSPAGFNQSYSTNVETMPGAGNGYSVNNAAKIVAPSGGNAVLAITPSG